ncbi:MAG: hypothetical protein RMJ46_07740 [Bacteroidota bacterium]|nr:hypothetical protein [Bacteroidota bacterium]
MKIAPIQPYVATVYGVLPPQPPPTRPIAEQAATERTAQTLQLTAAERELFVRLFPESAPYIAQHVLFTREGLVYEPDIYKGTLLDIRV